MPARSEKQRKMFGAALGRKRAGKSDPDDPKMSEAKLRDFASKSVSAKAKPMPKGHGKHGSMMQARDKKHAAKKHGTRKHGS